MRALLLVAGSSSRMGELTRDIHKSLLPIDGRPILDRILSALDSNAIRKVLFVGGSRIDQLRDHVSGTHPRLAAAWVENPDFATTNTAYSVWLAGEAFGREDDMLLINGDVVLDARAIARTLNGRGAHQPVNVLATRFDRCAEEEVKVLVEKDRITEIGKHIDPSRAAGESVGINLIARQHLDSLFATLGQRIENGDGRREYYEHAFNQMVGENVPFRAANVSDLPVMEVDTPEDYETVRSSIGHLLLP